MRLLPAILTLGLAASGTSFSHEAAPAPVSFTYSREAFQPWSIDTGWWPQTGPVQVRFVGHVGGGMSAQASGAVHLDWPAPELSVQGDPGAGNLEMNLGVELQTFLRLDLQLPYGQRFTWEGPIPMFPGFDYRFAGAQGFTPFLLEGQAPSTATVSDGIQQTKLYELSLTDQIIPIPGVQGSIEVSAGGLLDLILHQPKVMFPEGELFQHAGSIPVQLPEGARYQTTAGYAAQATYQGSLLVEPAVVIQLGPLEWDLARFELPVPLPAATEVWVFREQQPVGFDLPRADPDPADPDPGDPDAASPDGGAGDPPSPPVGCESAGAGGAAPLALLAVLALVARRRRRTAQRA